MTKIQELELKAKSLRGAAKSAVERRIAELKGFNTDVQKDSLSSIISDTFVLTGELEAALIELENKLVCIMAPIPVDSHSFDAQTAPVAITTALSTNIMLQDLTNRIKLITSSIQI